jgi:hypothetical protein
MSSLRPALKGYARIHGYGQRFANCEVAQSVGSSGQWTCHTEKVPAAGAHNARPNQ